MIIRNKQICLRLSQIEVDLLTDLSEQVSLSRTNFIRYVLKTYARRNSLVRNLSRVYP